MSNNYFSKSVSDYLKHFKVLLIIIAVLAATYFILLFTVPKKENPYYESPNTERVYGSRRVFDYGNQLSDSEEAELEAYIAAAEHETLCDIVIVTLNRSLKGYEPEYTANYTIPITPDKYVMVFADKFWEDNKFGYDAPQVLDGTTRTGDGVILVDNVYREEETGKIYTWMGTTGIAEETYSSSMIDYALDEFYYYVDDDYYRACTEFIDCVVDDMGYAETSFSGYYAGPLPVVIAFLVALIYFLSNKKSKAGRNTVTPASYTVAEPKFPERQDIFLRKTVTKHYNPPTSSSGSGGGGGHHSSGGGGSHGGGGHSR